MTATDKIKQAERAYFAEDDAMRRLWKRLERTDDPRGRARLFIEMADRELRMGAAAAVFDDEIHDEIGQTPAEWAAWESELLRLIAATEDHLADWLAGVDPLTEWDGQGTLDSQPLVATVLIDLCSTDDLEGRADLVSDLYEAVVDTVGGQAAEVLDAGVRHVYMRLHGPRSRWRRFLAWWTPAKATLPPLPWWGVATAQPDGSATVRRWCFKEHAELAADQAPAVSIQGPHPETGVDCVLDTMWPLVWDQDGTGWHFAATGWPCPTTPSGPLRVWSS